MFNRTPYNQLLLQGFLSLSLLFSHFVSAATVEDFSRHADYYNIKISPDGKHFAALINDNGNKQLAFFTSGEFKMTYILNAGKTVKLRIITGLIMNVLSFKLSKRVAH